MSACISRHGEYSEHTPDAEWTCTRCWDVDTAGLRAEVDRLTTELATAHTAWDEWKASSRAGHAHASDMAAEVVRLRAGIEDIRDEAWEPWLNRDWQHLNTVRNDCNALLDPTGGETDDR